VGEGAQEESIGLGLGLAHGLAQAMGGGLEVARSGPDGTSMRLTLPRAEGS
jgi:signal transduction histidine kinase